MKKNSVRRRRAKCLVFVFMWDEVAEFPISVVAEPNGDDLTLVFAQDRMSVLGGLSQSISDGRRSRNTALGRAMHPLPVLLVARTAPFVLRRADRAASHAHTGP